MILALLLAVSVVHVTDGDTIALRNGEHVRLLGIDTPETKKPGTPVQPCGPEAAAALRGLLAGEYPDAYAIVTLRYGQRRRDRYGRLLAYVYVRGKLLNLQLVQRGLAHADRKYKHPRMAVFVAAEEQAKAAQLGLWAVPVPCGGDQ
jgi:micrococcal nuclease